MARVVRPKTGRAVLLTQDKTSMFKVSLFDKMYASKIKGFFFFAYFQSAGKFNKYWKIQKNMHCNIGGLAALVFLMSRTEQIPDQ